jgi:hypothetical protein
VVPGWDDSFRAIAGVLGRDGFRAVGGGEESPAPTIVRGESGFGEASSGWLGRDARGAANGLGESYRIVLRLLKNTPVGMPGEDLLRSGV